MLLRLHISNYAIIDEAVIEPDKGLTVISGETGAGKSILLGALGLVLGKRADTSVLRSNDRKCVVEATFLLKDLMLEDYFSENDLEYAEETIIRREIQPSGKSRAFVNDSPVTLQILEPLASQLIQIHSQHETLDLSTSRFQFLMLDALAGHQELLKQYEDTFGNWKQVLAEIQEQENRLLRAKADEDYLQFQLSEMEAARLQDATPEDWEAELQQLEHAEEIRQQLFTVSRLLQDGDPAAAQMLAEAVSALRGIAGYQDSIRQLEERLVSLRIELEDIASEADKLGAAAQADPARAAMLQEKLSAIYQLYRKHQVQDLTALRALEEQFADQLNGIQTGDTRLTALRHQAAMLQLRLEKDGAALTAGRKQAGIRLQKDLHTLLAKVGMKDAVLEVTLPALQAPGPSGTSGVQFLFSANKGMAAREISKVASGGEMSRLMLCLKSLLAGTTALPTLIFDEIDTGVSGPIAYQVGEIMADLSTRHQVIAITHLPQIASRGSCHLLVAKKTSAKIASTEIRPLDQDGRIAEIARMLSGEEAGQAALENARDLLRIR